MRKRGFNMYMTKYRTKNEAQSIYTRYTPKLKNHQEAEARVYISHCISRGVSKGIERYIVKMTEDIACSITEQRR